MLYIIWLTFFFFTGTFLISKAEKIINKHRKLKEEKKSINEIEKSNADTLIKFWWINSIIATIMLYKVALKPFYPVLTNFLPQQGELVNSITAIFILFLIWILYLFLQFLVDYLLETHFENKKEKVKTTIEKETINNF